jgi:hypothetical protein
VNVYYRYRWDSILIIVPKDFDPKELATFRVIYPQAFMTILAPYEMDIPLSDVEIIRYKTSKELYLQDYRFKLVFNFTRESGLKKHFLALSAFHVLDLNALKKAAFEHALPNDSFSLLLKKALTRPNTLWKKDAK